MIDLLASEVRAMSFLRLVCTVFGRHKAVVIHEPLRKKTNKCLGENKCADQLRGNREADQPLCFCYTGSTIPPLLKYKIISL